MYKKKTRQGGFDQTHKAKISIGENSYIYLGLQVPLVLLIT
jgi:hypothetical protein